jgi:hypothetical protein
MRRLSLVLALIASFAIVATASAANPNFNTFGTGTVTEGPAGTFTIVNDPGEFGGVFLNSRSQSAKLIGDVDFSFDSSWRRRRRSAAPQHPHHRRGWYR